MEYPESQLVYSLSQLNKNFEFEIDSYLHLFKKQYKSRLKILFKEVFNQNDIQYQQRFLTGLFYFLTENIFIESKSKKEIEQEEINLPKLYKNIINISEIRFQILTLTIAYDIGIYFGEFLRKEIKGLEWQIETDTLSVDFGQIILKRNKIVFNFWQIMSVVLIKIYENRTNEDEFCKLFETWKAELTGNGIDYLAMINSWSKK